MRARTLRFGMAGVAAVFYAAACVSGDKASEAYRPLAIGAVVPSYTARTIAGESVRIGGGASAIVLNVWATWCESCREEMAILDTLARAFASRGMQVIAVSVDAGDGARVRRFADARRVAFTFAHDPAGLVQERYRTAGVPETYVIARDGRLVWRHQGSLVGQESALRDAAERAVGAWSTPGE